MFDTSIDTIAAVIAVVVDTLWADLVRPIILLAAAFTVFALSVAGAIWLAAAAFRLVVAVWNRARRPAGPTDAPHWK
jgi:hypothetical protein